MQEPLRRWKLSMLGRRLRLRLDDMRKAVLFLFLGACGWDPSHPFDRDAPPVKQAIGALDAGDAAAATALLEEYLSTGACAEGKIGKPDSLKTRPNGTFDLGLSLFKLGEAFGRRFGEEEIDAGVTDEQHQQRSAQIDCAIRIVQAIADDDAQPIDLKARARYLEGNLHFLNGEYEQAVKAYDKALTLAPGMVDAGDEVGRDAAWNRAIALKRIDDKKNDGGNDGGNEGGGDSGQTDGGNDASNNNDGGDSGGGNDGGDAGDGGGSGGNDSGPDANGGNDSGPPPPQTQNEEDAAAPPPKQTQDDRVLDKLEGAPTFQQEVAKKAAQQRKVRGVLDK
jgi:tetratricopeptide (TPR) repeat protein